MQGIVGRQLPSLLVEYRFDRRVQRQGLDTAGVNIQTLRQRRGLLAEPGHRPAGPLQYGPFTRITASRGE
ncbi:hypothetical protein GCM10022232_92470 [Streptomyces plumbiresistens]|uniref:Uncharacterized protein n=1 Tax=Streptomyces plumbiresistens TaxID=511811 RepID=A0ABP7TVW2_9ACTN